MVLAFQLNSYRGDRLVFHGGGWPGWGTLMTLVPDFGIGIAVFTNRSPSEVTSTLTWYIIRPAARPRAGRVARALRKQRDEFIAHMQADKDAREKARHKNTQPGARPRGLCRRVRASSLRRDCRSGNRTAHCIGRGAACSRP
jgi:hypothetical protein